MKIFIEKKRVWKYYAEERSPDINVSFFSEEFCEKFIRKYFEDGEKSKLNEYLHMLSSERKVHTVSTFFIGIYFYYFLEVNIYRKFKPSFQYLWFISSLYHDFGYCVEEETVSINQLNIKYDVFENLKIPNELLPFYDVDTIKEYSKYRLEKCKKNDHGIEGGKMLFDSLKKNFEVYKREYGQGKDDFIVDRGYSKIRFRHIHEKYYMECALNIMLHNIWFNSDDNNPYVDYSLSKLYKNKLVFSYSASLLFLLMFADTIEPLKRMDRIPNKNMKIILDNIFLESDKEIIKISYNQDELNNIGYPVEKWTQSIITMKDWIDIRIDTNDNQIILHRPIAH